MKKRIISVLLLIAMILSMLAGCGKNKNKNDNNKNDEETYQISLNKTSLNLSVGETENLVATVNPDVSEGSIKWKSSNSSVAAVDGGKVTAVGEGEATITASYSGASAKCKVTVTGDGQGNVGIGYDVSLDKISLELYVYDTASLVVSVNPSVDISLIKWESTDTSVATVDGGKVTAVGEGEATIIASYSGASATCIITVLKDETPVGSEIGNKCPSYSLDLIDGSGKVNIKDYAGKVVIINFWGTWCGPCKTELPDFDRIASEYSDDVVILAVHSVTGKNNAPGYIASNFANSNIVFAYDKTLSGSVDMYFNLLGGTGSYPRTLILNKRGNITFAQDGMVSYETLKENVDRLIGSQNAPSTESLPVYDGSPVEITFYHTMNQSKLQPILNNYIEEFNKLYPNITVTHSGFGDYDSLYDQIRLNITVGNQPNIAYCYPDHIAGFNAAGAVVSLDDFINCKATVTDAFGNKSAFGLTAEQIADFIPGFYAEGAIYDEKGTMYSIPMLKSTEALYYNKTFLDEHNLSVPTTWDEVEELCMIIKELYPGCIPLGYDSESNWFITMCEQYGSGYVSLDPDNHYIFDNETNRAFVERFRGWVDKGWVTTQELYGSYTSNAFTQGNMIMSITSTSGASYMSPGKDYSGNPIFEVGVASIPQVDPSNPKVISQGPSLCILNQTDSQEVAASWLFVEFLTTNAEFQAEFSMASGYVPVIKSAQNNSTFNEWLEFGNGINGLDALSVKFALSQADSYYSTPVFTGSSVARRQVGYLMVEIFSSTRTDIAKLIDEVFKRAIDECKNQY